MKDVVLERRDRQIHRSNRHMNSVRTNTDRPRKSTLERRHRQILRPHVPSGNLLLPHVLSIINMAICPLQSPLSLGKL